MTATSSRPSQSRSATAGVKSEKPPVHLGNPATGWPVRPSQACSAAESVARITSATPSPETSDSAGALMKARPWIGCENCDRLWPVNGSHTPTPECTWIPTRRLHDAGHDVRGGGPRLCDLGHTAAEEIARRRRGGERHDRAPLG